MDPDIGRWCLEFLLPNSTTDSTQIKKIICKIPVSDTDSKLKKALLLRTLQDELSTASIAESMLETLEVLEELHRCDGSSIPAAMSAAYCAIAIECTLKYLDLDSAYLKAVQRIWRGRVPYMEPSVSGEGSLLFSVELNRWRGEIEASLSDSEVMESLANMNTRRDAIHKLKVYLAEAWANMGPSFLELAASLQPKDTSRGNLVGSTDAVPSAGARVDVSIATHTTEMDMDMQELGESGSPAHQERGSQKDNLGKGTITSAVQDADVPYPHSFQNINARIDETTSVHHPRLMERNSTACVNEWDDSIDGLQGGTSDNTTRLHLPSPKRKKSSPLKKYEPEKITKRRKPKKWSELEEETLRTAVNKFGRGNWKLILNSHSDIFDKRTEVDLKDKWRNMTRYGGK